MGILGCNRHAAQGVNATGMAEVVRDKPFHSSPALRHCIETGVVVSAGGDALANNLPVAQAQCLCSLV